MLKKMLDFFVGAPPVVVRGLFNVNKVDPDIAAMLYKAGYLPVTGDPHLAITFVRSVNQG